MDNRAVARLHRLPQWFAVVAVFALGCSLAGAQTPEASLLNSERIERKFGSYGIAVLEADASVRVSDLFSTDSETGERTTRTFALVDYPATVADAVAAEHDTIVAGGSIGAVFKASGWAVLKANLWFGNVLSTTRLQRMMRLPGQTQLAVHIYALEVEREGRREPYARIVEVHHPAYLSLDAVRGIYAPAWAGGGEAEAAELLELLDRRAR